MLFWSLSLLYHAVERIFQSIVTTLLYLSLLIAVGHYTGWIERWIWFVLEKEASKVVNGAKVTIGGFRLDWSVILQGKIRVEISNAVLHTPQRQLWGWESPLIARAGKARVEVNAPITIFHEVFLRQKLPIDIYSVYVADIQVFVERHDQVINIYLCDPAAILPPPPYLTPPQNLAGASLTESVDFIRSQSDPLMGGRILGDDDIENEEDAILPSEIDLQQEKHKEQAQKLVSDMLQAVQSLGRAAQRGALHTAVKQQGLEIAERLRDGLSKRSRNTQNLEQGVALIEQVGKVAVESLKAPKLILLERKRGGVGPKPPLARVGRIYLKDVRVFTKDSWIQITHADQDNKQTRVKEHTGAFGSNRQAPSDTLLDEPETGIKRVHWNRPIYIETLVLRASELCPPMSSKDETDPDFPAIYQPMDKIADVVFRRLLAEMAKSNAGRLFSTALGEVLSFIQSNPQAMQATSQGTATPSTTSTANVRSTYPLATDASVKNAHGSAATLTTTLTSNSASTAPLNSMGSMSDSTHEVHV